MHTIGKLILSIILGILLLFAFVQTPFAKKWLKHELIALAHERKIDLSISTIRGFLPFEWILQDVEWSYLDQSFHLEKVKIRFALKELFHKKLVSSHLKILGKKPHPFEITGKAILSSTGLTISSCDMIGQKFLGRFEGFLGWDGQMKSGDCIFTISLPTAFTNSPFDGSICGNIRLNADTASLECYSDQLTFRGIPFQRSSLNVHAVKTNSLWHASASFEGGHADIPCKGKAECHYSPSSQLITIEKCILSSPETTFSSDMEFDIRLQSFEGYILAQCFNLEKLRPLFPSSELQGRFEAKCDFHSSSNQQDINLYVHGENLAAYGSKMKYFNIKALVQDIFANMHGECTIKALESTHKEIHIAEMNIHSSFTPHKSPFSLLMVGYVKDPLEITISGNWQKRDRGVFFDVRDCSGFVLKKPFSLREPFSVEWNEAQFKMSQLSLDIAEGYFSSRMDFTPETSLIKIDAKSFPIDFLQFFRKDVAIEGTTSISIDLVSWKDNIQGSCNCVLEQAKLRLEDEEQHPIKGSIQIHLSQNKAQIHGEMRAKEEQFLHFSGSLPINYQHFPFNITLDQKGSLSGSLVAEGKLEHLFEFVNIGSQRIKGWLSTQLFFSKSWEAPCVQGSLEIQNGKYENYMTGTYLKNISVKAKANKQAIHINSFTATDDAKGKVEARGIVSLSPRAHFLFELNAELQECDTVSFDTITGKFSGNLVINGNFLGAIAKGKLKVDEVYFHIPDKLPTTLPDLPIKFIHIPEHLTNFRKRAPSSSPLLLDLEIDAPRKVFIEGKGLHAQLEGNLHITGTYTDVIASGTLRLLNGEYLLSGKVFTLNEGELICNDKPTPSAYISLKGTCDLPEVSVTALLRGPISSPQLTFQSSPQLSTSALLAQILFNKDISEISAIQALQLAQTVFSLSNNAAPDVFEKIRKTLGIDRLTLITSENDPGKISLQIGKYLMRGVLLTLSQGAESRNVAVEVELKRGIMLQAEMNENQQGKFSLKWHHHY